MIDKAIISWHESPDSINIDLRSEISNTLHHFFKDNVAFELSDPYFHILQGKNIIYAC